MITVTLYSRPGCHLCEQVKNDLAVINVNIPHVLNEINIESDSVLHKKFLTDIPVVEIGAFMLKAPISYSDLLRTLGAVRDSQQQQELILKKHEYQPNTADQISYWVAKHWLFGVNLIFIVYLGLPFLAPTLLKNGQNLPANLIYTAYSPLCHQLGFRSFFMFGEQSYYPREAANIPDVITFGKATGIDENDLLSARRFTGNEKLGYKIALCERDVAIYAAIILFGFLFSLTGRKIPPLHWAIWLIIAIGPIALDGFSQLFSQIPIQFFQSIIPYRESTPLLRILTGSLFGFGTAWFGLPYVEESMNETLAIMSRRSEVR